MNQKNWNPIFNRAKAEIKLNSKSRPVVSESNPVPMYRAYGVTKKETIFTKINELLATVIGWLMFLPSIAIIVIGTISMIYILGYTGIFLTWLSAFLFIYFFVGRKIRKRAKFLIKLKRQCKKMGYLFEYKRSFFAGIRPNKKGIDFVIHTPGKKWYVRFLTPKKRLCHITILDKNNIEIKSNIIHSKWKDVLGLDKVKIKLVEYSFDEVFASDGVETQKVLLVNPVPYDMFKKDIYGARIPIGTGERLYDYIMCSGTGFINTLKREYDEKNGEH